MSTDPGLGYEQIVGAETQGIGAAWGTPRGSLLRRIFNAVLPVAVVSEFRGESEGSVFGITAGSQYGSNGHRPAVEFFNTHFDWQIHEASLWFTVPQEFGGYPAVDDYQLCFAHMFTPLAAYNPIEFNTSGYWFPALVTNRAFSQGGLAAQFGTNPIGYPFGFGYFLHMGDHPQQTHASRNSANNVISNDSIGSPVHPGGDKLDSSWDKKCVNRKFDPPIRMRRHHVIDFQIAGNDRYFEGSPSIGMWVSLLYTELPNPRGEYP